MSTEKNEHASFVTATFYLTPEIKAKIKDAAKKEQSNGSHIARKALTEYFEKHGGE